MQMLMTSPRTVYLWDDADVPDVIGNGLLVRRDDADVPDVIGNGLLVRCDDADVPDVIGKTR